MVTLGPHSAVAGQCAVHCLREANGQALKAADERAVRVAFDQEVYVVTLNGEFGDAELRVGRTSQRTAQRLKDMRDAQRGEPARCTESHVHGTTWVVRRPAAMRH